MNDMLNKEKSTNNACTCACSSTSSRMRTRSFALNLSIDVISRHGLRNIRIYNGYIESSSEKKALISALAYCTEVGISESHCRGKFISK